MIAGGRTRHMETRLFFLREMKENGIIKTKWRRGDNNPADMFTKNLAGPAFVKESTGNDQGKDDEIKTYLQTKLNNTYLSC